LEREKENPKTASFHSLTIRHREFAVPGTGSFFAWKKSQDAFFTPGAVR
jgi:hypothetical protein